MSDGNAHRDPATPEQIWEILREISAVQQETARRMQETDQLIKRQARAADRRMDKLDEMFNGQWGKLIESLVEGDLAELAPQTAACGRRGTTANLHGGCRFIRSRVGFHRAHVNTALAARSSPTADRQSE